MRLLMLAIMLSLATQTVLADQADNCIYQWETLIEKLNYVEKKLDRGFDIVLTNPEKAFDRFNKAHSTASTYRGDFRDLYGSCKKVTNITKSMATEANDEMKWLEVRSDCSMDFASAVGRYTAIIERIECFSDLSSKHGDTYSGLEVVLLPHVRHTNISIKSTIKKFNTLINYTSACDDEGDILRTAQNIKDHLNAMKKNHSAAERKFNSVLEARE